MLIKDDFDLNTYPFKAINMRLAATLCEACGEGLPMGEAVLAVDNKLDEGYGYFHGKCLGLADCDFCHTPITSPVRASYVIPGFVIQHTYCSEDCKGWHKMKLILESGL